MNVNIQETLQNDQIILNPLKEDDFEDLYAVASDPKIWEQHPNKNRWKREVFEVFFEGAMQSKGAYKVVEKETGHTIGCTRFYDYNSLESSIMLGYTFYGTAYWGRGYNHAVKKIMLDYIFQFVSTVYFHIGAENLRSQISIGRLGAVKVREEELSYFGEASKLNFVYIITKEQWAKNHQ